MTKRAVSTTKKAAKGTAAGKKRQAEVDAILKIALKEPGILEAVELYESAMAHYHAATQHLAPVVRTTASSSDTRWS